MLETEWENQVSNHGIANIGILKHKLNSFNKYTRRMLKEFDISDDQIDWWEERLVLVVGSHFAQKDTSKHH